MKRRIWITAFTIAGLLGLAASILLLAWELHSQTAYLTELLKRM